MNSTKQQRQRIYQLCRGDKEKKRSLVFGITNDMRLTSTHDLDFDQANGLILSLGGTPEARWSSFTPGNKQHSYILSLCMQAGHCVQHPKYGQVADLNWLDKFLHEDSPVKKALRSMSTEETSKVIHALEKTTKWSNGRKVQS